MGRYVNPGNVGFQVALNSTYVDKTGLLEYTNSVMGTKSAWICNSRPRRFGKSTTVDMLVAYYSKGCDSKHLFSGLRISEKFNRCYDLRIVSFISNLPCLFTKSLKLPLCHEIILFLFGSTFTLFSLT